MPNLHHPDATGLQTGDLLFPKVSSSPTRSPLWLSLRRKLDEPDVGRDKSMREYLTEFLGPEPVEALANDAFSTDVSALLVRPRLRSLSLSAFSANLARIASTLSALEPAQKAWSAGAFAQAQGQSMLGADLMRLSAMDSDTTAKARRAYLMLVILWKSFGGLLHDWLDMTVAQFMAHPLCELLFGAIERESGPGFFVGHVAMVLRERDGCHVAPNDGQVWVIEANTTDFSHYRVAVHPYLVPGEPVAPPKPGDVVPPRLRGWANRRLSIGESIWHSRHRGLLAGDGDAGVLDLRRRLGDMAKSYLGRPYGFFDEPKFGDDGRFYCGEYVHTVFERVGQGALEVDQNRTWKWLYDNRSLLGDADFVKRLEIALQTGDLLQQMEGRRFFLLTLPMLYKSSALVAQQDAATTPPYL